MEFISIIELQLHSNYCICIQQLFIEAETNFLKYLCTFIYFLRKFALYIESLRLNVCVSVCYRYQYICLSVRLSDRFEKQCRATKLSGISIYPKINVHSVLSRELINNWWWKKKFTQNWSSSIYTGRFLLLHLSGSSFTGQTLSQWLGTFYRWFVKSIIVHGV